MDPQIDIIAQQLINHYNQQFLTQAITNDPSLLDEYKQFIKEKEKRDRENSGFIHGIKSGGRAVGRFLGTIWNTVGKI